MMNFQQHTSSPWSTFLKQTQKPTIKVLAMIGLAVSAIGMPSYSSEAARPIDAAGLENGTYVYGQAEEHGQVGSEYLVFEVNQGQVVGGFYMPNSSFDCFYGNVENNQLALTVVDSYERTQHPYAVALQSAGTVAMAGGGTAADIGLEGYHQLDNLDDIDQNVLATCKADYSQTHP